MAAYNELVIVAPCPSCGATGELCFQLHSWASFDGDDTGRFSHRQYRLGERLAWWPDADPRRLRTKTETNALENGSDTAEECYGVCRHCQAAVVATVVLQDRCLVDAANIRADLT